ncbi:MAG TPA: hypothetical protein VJ921_12450, partial [Vicinamibacteria bacterium]|nr:hypothetical protein [Vicinamibacteria bacterium]
RREGKPVGGIVFRSREQDVAIVDLLGIADEGVLRELVREVVDVGRSRKADRVVIALSSAHRWIATFGKLGFSRRDSAPYFVYARPGALDAESPWSLTSGDRDL